MLSKEDYIAARERLETHKAYGPAVAALRGLLIYLYCLAIPALAMQDFRSAFRGGMESLLPDTAVLYCSIVVELLLLVLIYNTAILAFAVHYHHDRKGFLKGFDGEISIQAVYRDLHTSPAFWIELAVLWLCFAVFSPSKGFDCILLLLPRSVKLSLFAERAILTCIFAVISYLLTLHARIDSRKLWLELPARLAKSKLWKSPEIKKKNAYSYWKLALKLIGYGALYLLIVPILTVVMMVLVSILKIVKMLSFQWWLLIPIAAIIAWSYLRALFKRMGYIKRLRRLCKAYRFELLSLKHPYLSVFRQPKGYTFALRADKKTYYCRLIASVSRSKKMIISDNGSCIRRWSFHIPQPQFARSGAFLQVNDRGNGDDRELFGIESSFDYTFEADGEKLLLLNPVSKRTQKELQKHRSEMDNGDRIGEYSVFTGNAFLRYLERIYEK